MLRCKTGTARPMFDLGEFLPYLINRIGSRLALNFGREIKHLGVDIQEWRVLAVLAAHGPQRMSGLQAFTSIDISTLSRLVGRMVRKRLVNRARPNGDKREVLISLAEKGVETARAILPTARRYQRVVHSGLSAEETRMLKQFLVRVYSNIDALSHTDKRS